MLTATNNLFPGLLWERCAALAFALLLGLAFAPTLLEMGSEWFKHAEYGHGLLMPPAAMYILWTRRRQLAALRRTGRGSPWAEIGAVLALLPLGVLLLLGEMRLSWFLKPFAFVGALAACIVVLYSWQGLRALAAPLFVLALMCPIPWRVLVWVTLPLKRHAAVLATGLADLSGLQASLQGNLIHVPGISSLQVVDQCSGVRSFVSLLSVALLFCLFWKRHWLLKAAVILACAPIAVAVNGARIWLTALLSVHVSPDAAQGFFHLFEGLILFGVAGLALAVWACFLSRVIPRRPAGPAPEPAALPFRADRPLLRGALVAVAALALAGTGLGAHRVRDRLGGSDSDTAAVVLMHSAFASVPLEIGPYRGETQVWDDRIVAASGADAYASVRYVDEEGRPYELYVGGALRNRDNFHAPNVCMPTAGWETLAAATVPLRPYADEGTEPVMQRLLLQRGDQRMLAYYWFQAGNRLAGSEWAVRINRLLDLLRGQPPSPTMIVSVYVPVDEDESAADAAALRFLTAIAPPLRAATASGGVHG